MMRATPIDPLLDGLHRDPGESELSKLRPAIDRIFSSDSVEAILSRLDAETGAHAGWAKETAALIRQRAPLSLKIALRQIREGRHKPSLKEELQTEFRLVCHLLRRPDLR
ncbi:MAG: enoyl-CoA hydratase/isomerase family protein [Rhodomicrobium sp.]|nr:enoyl-CoA hydratase/isomerase family protein [Rhodomicrobium sp.]